MSHFSLQRFCVIFVVVVALFLLLFCVAFVVVVALFLLLFCVVFVVPSLTSALPPCFVFVPFCFGVVRFRPGMVGFTLVFHINDDIIIGK